MVMRRSERPNPLLKHVEEYRKSSKSLLKLEREEIKRLAHLQAEAFVNRPDMQNKLKDIIGASKS
jgi:hypothetical protein